MSGRRPVQVLLLAAVSGSVAAALVLSLGMGSAGMSARIPANLVAGGVRSGAVALTATGTPVVAYVRGRTLYVSTRRARVWHAEAAGRLPRAVRYRVQLALDPAGTPTVLVQDVPGRWLAVVGRRAGHWRPLLRAHAAGRSSTLGPAGLALDAKLRPVVASAFRDANRATGLRLLRMLGDRLSATEITRRGFPSSVDPPAAFPVLLPDRALHVVEAFGTPSDVQGVEWGPERDGWWGQSLHAAAFDRTVGPVKALVDGKGRLWSAWTAVGFGRAMVVLAARDGTTERSTLFEGARLAALALGPEGPELAVNGSAGGRILQGGRAPVAVAGTVSDLAVGPDGERVVLLTRNGGLYLDRAPLGRLLAPGKRSDV